MTTDQTPWTVDEIGGERARSMLQIVLTELGITPDWRGEQAELQVQSALWQLQKRADQAESERNALDLVRIEGSIEQLRNTCALHAERLDTLEKRYSGPEQSSEPVSDLSEFATLTDLTDEEHDEFTRNAMSARDALMTSFQRRVADAVQAAMSSTTLKIDGNALARTVNTHNRRTDRR